MKVFIVSLIYDVICAVTFIFCYNWFLVPAGLPNLKPLHIIGILYSWYFINGQVKPSEKKDQNEITDYLLNNIYTKLSFLLFCWIIHLFM